MLVGMVGILSSCQTELIEPVTPQAITKELVILNNVGIRLQTSFVTTEVAMNVKAQTAGVVTIKILNIGNKVVSKEEVNIKAGDNLLKVYTTALPSSAYRIGLYDKDGAQMGITDFNKL